MKYKRIYEDTEREITRDEALKILENSYRNAERILELLENGSFKRVKVLGGYIEVS